MAASLRDWEALLHERYLDLPPLVVCGLLYYQFETIHYFFTGVAIQAKDALIRAERLTDLQTRYRGEVAGDRGKASYLVDRLFSNPFVTTQGVMCPFEITNAGANNLLRRLEDRGWLVPAHVGGRGGKITWFAPEVMDILRPERT